MFTCLLFTNPSKYIPSQNTSVGLNTSQIRGFILWSAPNTQKESSRTHFIPQDRACEFAKCTYTVKLTLRILSSQLSMLISLQHVPFIGTLLCRFPKTFGTTPEKSQQLLPEHVKWSQRTKKTFGGQSTFSEVPRNRGAGQQSLFFTSNFDILSYLKIVNITNDYISINILSSKINENTNYY